MSRGRLSPQPPLGKLWPNPDLYLRILTSRNKITAAVVRIAASSTSSNEYGPPPRTMGIGPIRIIAPPLTFPVFDSDPRVTSSTPMNMAAKATKNKMLANPNCIGWL